MKLGQGYIFIGVCDSVHGEGGGGRAWLRGACVVAEGLRGCWGVCMVAGGHVWLLEGRPGCWGSCVVARGMRGCWRGVPGCGGSGCRGACMLVGGGGVHGCRGACLVVKGEACVRGT